MASLKLNGVNKVFPSGSLALYDVNLEAKDKEFLVVLGGEASGKSTMLRVIAGLEEATSGEIFIDGKDMTDVDPKDRNIAMVFRGGTLYPALNVYENMAFGLKLRKASPALIEQRVKAAANILGLNDVLYRKPKTLSAAQKQRVSVARAIVREPAVYLFDEPLAGLDDNLKGELLNIIINLQARMEGTFVYATKSVAEALTIGTRIIVIKNGIIQQIDSPFNLYDYPANAYVAFMVGAPSINFINNAKIVKDGEGVFAVDGEFKIPVAESVLKRFEKLDEYANTEKKVIVGIRPEDILAGEEGFEAVTEKVENDGDSYFAECALFGHDLVVTCNEKTVKDAKTKLKIDSQRLYIFDAETRLTLLNRDEGYQNTGFAEADYVPPSFAEEENIIKKFKPEKPSKKKR